MADTPHDIQFSLAEFDRSQLPESQRGLEGDDYRHAVRENLATQFAGQGGAAEIVVTGDRVIIRWKESSEPESLGEQGGNLLKQGEHDKGTALLRLALERDPDDAAALFNLGIAQPDPTDDSLGSEDLDGLYGDYIRSISEGNSTKWAHEFPHNVHRIRRIPWWNLNIPGDSTHYDWIDMGAGDAADECPRAFGMLVRWILRTKIWLTRFEDHEELSWGGETRISIRWFHGWLEERMDCPLSGFLRDLYADLIFTQHLRVALSRLDPGAPKQRLRFMLGDFGIVATAGMEKKIGENNAPWMADRLDAWLCLLADVEVLNLGNEEREYACGRNAWRL